LRQILIYQRNGQEGPCRTTGETSIPKNILYVLSEGEKRKRKFYEKVETPVPEDRCWNRNCRIPEVDDDENLLEWGQMTEK
jgi:hypothetical protein